MIRGEGAEGFAQAAAHRRDVLQLFRGKVVQVLVHRVAGVDLVLDPVQAGHQHGGERQVRVGGRVGEADFHALGLRVGRIRDAARRRTVAGGVGQQHRRFEPGDQPLVAVGRRVGECVQRLGVLDDAADVIQASFRQIGVAIAGEQRLAGLPDRLVDVHARTVIAVDRLRHEGRGFAVAVGHVVHAVFVYLHVVGLLGQGTELGAQLVLALRDFVVMLFDRQAHLAHRRQHLGAQVHIAIDGCHREVAALDGRAMAHVAFRVVLDGGLRAFDAIQLVHTVVAAGAEFHTVEDEELGFGADVDGVADAAAFHICLGLLRGTARVAGIALAGGRLDNVADDDRLRLGRERIHHDGLGIQHQDHVGLVDRLPAGDGRTVEHDAVAEHVLIDGRDVLRGVMPLAARVGEPQVHIFDVLLLEHIQHFLHAGIRRRRLLHHA